MRSPTRCACFRALLYIILCPVTIPLHAQMTGNPSFGNILVPAKRVTLRRSLPPVFDAHGHTVSVVVEPGVNGLVATQLQSDLESYLTAGNSGIIVQAEHADLKLYCKPVVFTGPHVTNENVNGIQTSTLSGSIEVQVQITMTASGRVLAANRYTGNLSQELSQTSQGSPAKTRTVLGMKVQTGGPVTSQKSNQTPEQMQNNLVATAAVNIASYLVSTPQQVDVPLASGGALNEANRLAEAGLWSRDLETLESMSPFATLRADAFRVYDMGVANEALGYATQDMKASMKFLSEASNDYGKAMDAAPDNRQFIASQDRIKAALAQLTARAGMAKANMEQEAAVKQQHAATVAAESSEPPLTDDDVMQMVGAHLDEANVIDTIQHANRVHFDLSVPAQLRLTHAGVNGHVLMAMKTRARDTAGAK